MMTIGEVISELEQAKPDAQVYFAFGHVRPTTVDSWRGIYAHAALGFTGGQYGGTHVTVSALLSELKFALGKEYRGWKGGEYRYDSNTPLHIDNSGCCTHTELRRIEIDDYCVILHTATEEPRY